MLIIYIEIIRPRTHMRKSQHVLSDFWTSPVWLQLFQWLSEWFNSEILVLDFFRGWCYDNQGVRLSSTLWNF